MADNSQAGGPIRLRASGAGWHGRAGVLVIVLPVFAGYMVTASQPALAAAVGISGGVGAVIVAARRPVAVFRLGVAAMVLLPPYSIKLPTGPPHPAVAVFAALGIGLALRGRRGPHSARQGLSLMDAAVIVLFAAMLANVVHGDRSRHDIEPLAIGWGIPYLTARTLVASRILSVRDFLKTWVVAATALIPFACLEAATGVNVFHHIAYHANSGTPWYVLPSNGAARFGIHRVVASMGHPIAFAMFMASAGLMSTALAITARAGRARYWYAVAIALIAVSGLALSRTGWVVAGIGLVLILLVAARSLGARVLPLAGTVLLVAVLGLSAIPQLSELVLGLGINDPYRQTLISYALTGHALHWFGNQISAFYLVALNGPAANPSVDNQYLRMANSWGYIGLLGFVAVFAVAVWLTARRGPLMSQLLGAIAVGSLAGLAAVALITQEQCVIWAILGALGAGSQLPTAALRQVPSAGPLGEGQRLRRSAELSHQFS